MRDRLGLNIQVGDGIRVIDCNEIVVVFAIHESEDCVSYVTGNNIVRKSSKGFHARSLIGNMCN